MPKTMMKIKLLMGIKKNGTKVLLRAKTMVELELGSLINHILQEFGFPKHLLKIKKKQKLNQKNCTNIITSHISQQKVIKTAKPKKITNSKTNLTSKKVLRITIIKQISLIS